MWNTSCSNKICFTQDKTYEQNLHLKRLFCIRPQINVSRPYTPNFLLIKGPQREKRKQTQVEINKGNYILQRKIIDVNNKNGKYSKYVVMPKEIYPAFRRYSNLKISDIINMININFDNQRLQNKIINLKSNYDNDEMHKEAEKQEKYLQNILNRPKSIPFTPALNFISIEQLHKRLKNQLIRQQKYLNEQQTTNENISKRGNSAGHLRTNTNNNNSKINKKNENNKSGNRTNRSKRSQSSKNKKSLKINSDIEIENQNDKRIKKDTTTKANTGIKK